jgi:hypothetical protein
MSINVEKLTRVAEIERMDLELLRQKVRDNVKDKNGSSSNSLSGALRLIAVTDYLSKKDVPAFRRGLSEAAELYSQLFDRFDAGDPISPSYISMLSYKALFNALAARDFDLARSFSKKMGGRQAIEAKYDRPFDIALGYSLKSLLESDNQSASRWIPQLEELCLAPENLDFQGYAKVLRAIASRDSELVNEGLNDVIAGHKRQSKGNGLFKDMEDELLCVWGIGMANLARMLGLTPQAKDPLIPSILLS